MLHRPNQGHRKDTQKHKNPLKAPYRTDQHGDDAPRFSHFLALPAESLTHITSFLSPPDLFALSKTNSQLYEHIKDDNTWRRAFICHFLGVGPERDLNNATALLLRRTERTWRKEFISRHNFLRRWELSRNATVTHSPLDEAEIHSMHFMNTNGLLSASLKYGVVARSLPLNGKKLKGYLDAAGTGPGIGNPNAEFSPDVSALRLASDGGAARVYWGFRNGGVATTLANRAMDSGRTTHHFKKSHGIAQHDGAVLDIIGDVPSGVFASAGADGRVKVWDSKHVRCLWTSEQQTRQLAPVAVVKLSGMLSSGILVGALKNGDIVLWTGLDKISNGSVGETAMSISIASPRFNPRRLDTLVGDMDLHTISITHLDAERITLLLAYGDQPYVYRLNVSPANGAVTTAVFGEESENYISAVEIVLNPAASLAVSPEMEGRPFVLVGDQLGFINIIDWSSLSHSTSKTTASINHVDLVSSSPPTASPTNAPTLAPPTHKFQAFDNGAVTALAWSPTVLVAGSSRGSTTAYNAITLEPLRYFVSPAARPRAGAAWPGISHLLLERESLCIAAGGRVMSWVIGPVPGKDHGRRSHGHNKKHEKSPRSNATSKGHLQYEILKDIKESCKELESERAHAQRVYGREREQRSGLNALGLSEQEAIAYVLMLSRDEEEKRRLAGIDEGVFLGDFDDFQQAGPSSSSTWQRTGGSDSDMEKDKPRVEVSRSNEKVRVSPPYVAEPREAGTGSDASSESDPRSDSSAGSRVSTPLAGSDQDNFPLVNSSASESGRSFSHPTGPGLVLSMSPAASRSVSHSSATSGVSSSVESSRSTSAWNTPLRALSIPGTPPNRQLTLVEHGSPSNDRGLRYIYGHGQGPRSISGSSLAGSASPSSFSSMAAHGGISLLSAEMARLGHGTRSEDTSVDANTSTGNAGGGGEEEEMDDDLKFAIELSLAEARSQEEANRVQ